MNAILLGPPGVAQTLETLLVQRGVRVVTSISANLKEAQQELLSIKSQLDLVCVIANSDPASTRSVLQGLRLLTDRPIILFGVISEPTEILRLVRAGATDYINVSSDFVGELDEILAHMRGHSARPEQRGVAVAFCGASGGVGATTLAVNCALHLALAESRPRVALVDLNLSGGDTALHLGLQPQSTIMHCPVAEEDIHAMTVSKLITRHESGLSLIAAPQYLDDQGVMRPETIHQLISVLTATHDFVIIDLEDVFHREQIAAMSLADRLMVTLRIEFPSIVRTRRLLDYLANIPLENIQLCVNQMPAGSGITRERAEAVLRRPIDYLIPDEIRQATDSLNVGVPVVSEYPRTKLAKTCMQIGDDLLRQLKSRSEVNHVSESATY